MKISIEHDKYGNLHRCTVYAMGRFISALGTNRQNAKKHLLAKVRSQIGTTPSRIREVEEIEI